MELARVSAHALCAALVIVAAGCGAQTSSPTGTPATTPQAQPPAPTQTSSGTPSTERSSAISPSSSLPAEPSSAPSASSGAVLTAPAVAGSPQTLTLSDAREHNSSWTDGSFQTSQSGDQVKAIATPVSCYSPKELEYRFAKQTGKLVVGVAQDLNSKSSSTILQFSLYANGRSVSEKKINFNQQERLSAPLTGVNSLIIKVAATQPSNSSGSCDTTALLTSITVESS